MKIIHNVGWYLPDSCGGTEVYVDGLVQGLKAHKIQNVITAPSSNEKPSFYNYNGISVYRYPNYPYASKEQTRGYEPCKGFDEFSSWLASQKADIYHQHSWVKGCDIHHLRKAKELGMATVTTIHTAGNVCLRATMLLNGKEVCDGKIDPKRCSRCWGQDRGISEATAKLISAIPNRLSKIVDKSFLDSRLITAIATPALVINHHNKLLEMASLADKVVVVCQWLYDALIINGVPKNKIVLCRQGLSSQILSPNFKAIKSSQENAPLKLGYLGRWHKIKGLHILIEAVRNLPSDVPVELIIYGLAQIKPTDDYQQEIIALAKNDSRIKLAPPLNRNDVLPALAKLDMLVVPSQCLETGPLVVLEAQAVGTPVLGSNLGGIGELVSHGINGWLVPAVDVFAWSQAITLFAKDRNLLAQLNQDIKSVRTMNQVALEMLETYQEILKV